MKYKSSLSRTWRTLEITSFHWTEGGKNLGCLLLTDVSVRITTKCVNSLWCQKCTLENITNINMDDNVMCVCVCVCLKNTNNYWYRTSIKYFVLYSQTLAWYNFISVWLLPEESIAVLLTADLFSVQLHMQWTHGAEHMIIHICLSHSTCVCSVLFHSLIMFSGSNFI
jgi:hypothetical protein